MNIPRGRALISLFHGSPGVHIRVSLKKVGHFIQQVRISWEISIPTSMTATTLPLSPILVPAIRRLKGNQGAYQEEITGDTYRRPINKDFLCFYSPLHLPWSGSSLIFLLVSARKVSSTWKKVKEKWVHDKYQILPMLRISWASRFLFF